MKGLYVVAASVMAGISAVFALLAELEDRYGLGQGSLGWISGAAFAAALVAQLGLARYADRGHGLALLRGGVVLATFGLLWFATATELWQFIAARAVLGASAGMIIPAARRAIVVSAGDDMGQRLGVFYAAYLSGFVFGPPVAGLLATLGDVRLPFVVFGAVVGLSALALRGLDMGDHPAADAGATALPSGGVLRRLVRDRRMIAALLVVVSFRYSVGVFEPLWAVFLDDLGASTMLITLSLTMFAAPILLIARWAGGVSDRHGARFTSVGAAVVVALMTISYGWIGVLPVVIALAVANGVFECLQTPGSQAAVADAAPHRDAAAAQGLAEAAGSAAAAIGAFTAAPSFARWGAGPAWTIAGVAMLTIVGVSALLDRPRHELRLQAA